MSLVRGLALLAAIPAVVVLVAAVAGAGLPTVLTLAQITVAAVATALIVSG